MTTRSIQVARRVDPIMDRVYSMHAVPIRDTHEPWIGSRWYRSSNFANVVYVSGHICLNTLRPIRHCTCDICAGFEANWGLHAINTNDSTLYVRIMDNLHDPELTLANIYVFRVREDLLSDPNITVLHNAFVTTVHEACVVDGEDIHPRHNPLPSTAVSSKSEPSSAKRRRHLVRVERQLHRRIISDSGASKHMFSDRSMFTDYVECSNVFVRVAEGSSAKVLGTGSVGPLKNVLHVQGLVFDLVSEPALARAGMSGTWAGVSRVVKYPDGKTFLEATLADDDLYEVNPLYL